MTPNRGLKSMGWGQACDRGTGNTFCLARWGYKTRGRAMQALKAHRLGGCESQIGLVLHPDGRREEVMRDA